MLVTVLMLCAQILLRVLVESLLASERTEVVGLSLVLGCTSGSGGINVHAAARIMYGGCHTLFPFHKL